MNLSCQSIRNSATNVVKKSGLIDLIVLASVNAELIPFLAFLLESSIYLLAMFE